MRYCPRCVLPDSRPRIWFDDEGNCNCGTAEIKREIDWCERELAFRDVVASARARGAEYDCVIPVSGGKDSTWQVIKCLEYGLKPLCVTWRSPARNSLGTRNLENLIELGVDHVDFRINPKVEKLFTLKSFVERGATAIPMHMGLFAIPTKMAVRFAVPLVMWGENSAFEYGGNEELRKGSVLDEAWYLNYGVTNGTTATDWVGDDLSARDLAPFFMPSDAELQALDIRAVFLGGYFRWDPVETYRVAAKNGFQASADGPKIGYYDFADLDDDFIIPVHHYLKWHKYGFTRLFDNLSLEIRAGRMTREEAIEIIRHTGDQAPYEAIRRFCAYVDITEAFFFEVCDRFRDPRIWTKRDDVWMIEDFIIEDWNWR